MEKGWCNYVAWCLSQAAAPHKTSPTLFHNSLGAGSLIWFKRELKDHRLRRVRSARYNYNKLAASVVRKYFSLDIYLRIRLIITVDIIHLPALKSELNAWKDFPCFARVHPPPPAPVSAQISSVNCLMDCTKFWQNSQTSQQRFWPGAWNFLRTCQLAVEVMGYNDNI